MKAWVIFFLVGGILVFSLGATNPVASADANLLEVLAADDASDWARGWKAGVVRWVAGPEATNPRAGLQRLENALRIRSLLPLIQDLALFLFLGILGMIIATFWKRSRAAAPWVTLALLLCWLAFQSWKRPAWSFPGLSTEGKLDLAEQLIRAHEVAIKSAGEAPVWMSSAAVRWLPQVGISIPPTDMNAIVAEAGNSALWRAKAADNNVGAILLIGNVAEYRPLLDYLMVAPGWSLSSIEPSSLVFAPKASSSATLQQALPDALTLEQHHPDPSARAAYLAHLATMLTDLGAYGEARRMFRQASELDGNRPDVRSLHASFLARRGQWQEAIFEAREVLSKNSNFIPAWQVLVQAELAAERPENAWTAAKSLLRLQPRDPYVLFLHARAANAAGASFAETESLRRLIRITSQMGLSTSGYKVLLGKSLAKQGLIDQARSEFEAALSSGDLSSEQQEQVKEFLTRLEEAASR